MKVAWFVPGDCILGTLPRALKQYASQKQPGFKHAVCLEVCPTSAPFLMACLALCFWCLLVLLLENKRLGKLDFDVFESTSCRRREGISIGETMI